MAQQELTSFGKMGKTLQDSYIPQLRQNYESAKNATEALDPERTLNVKFLAGRQWLAWNATLNAPQVIHPMFEGGKIEPVIDNVLEPLTSQRVSFLASATPSFESTSVTAQGQDMSGASLVDRMLGVFWDKYNLSDFFSRGHYVDSARYNCFYRAYWDYGAGAITRKAVPVEGVDGMTEQRYRAAGDIQLERVNPENVFVDPLAERVMPVRTEVTDARWLFHLRIVDIGWLMKQPWKQGMVETLQRGDEKREVIWGGLPKEEDIAPADSTAATEGDKAALGALGIDTEDAAKGASIHPNPERKGAQGKMVKVLFYYEHRSEDFPHGRFAVFLPDFDWWVCEYREELPHATNDFPEGLFLWVMSKDKEMTGRLAGECRVTQARPQQVELNYAWTMWRVLRKSIKPTLFYDEDATTNIQGMLSSNYMNAVGYHSNAGHTGDPMPKLFWPPALQLESGTAQIEAQFITRKIEDKIGIHNPANIPHKQGTTWSEISTILMRDLDNMRDGDVIRHETTVYSPLLDGMVRLAQRFMPEGELLSFFGDKGQPEVIKFKKSELNWSDIRIVKGSTMRKSKALLVDLYMTWYKLAATSGLDPATLKGMLSDALAVMSMQLTTESTLDVMAKNRAQNENMLLLEGKEVPVAWHEPVAIHNQDHMRFLNSNDFYNAPEGMKPLILKVTYEHMNGHNQVARLSQNEPTQAIMLGLQAVDPNNQQSSPSGPSQPPIGVSAQPTASQSGGQEEQIPATEAGLGVPQGEPPAQPMPPIPQP